MVTVSDRTQVSTAESIEFAMDRNVFDLSTL
jgi:hypothetical protein